MQDKQFSFRREAFSSVIVRRVVGPAFFVGGIVVGGYGAFGLATMANVLVENQTTNDWFYVAIALVLPALIAILGLLLQRADPYYIDE